MATKRNISNRILRLAAIFVSLSSFALSFTGVKTRAASDWRDKDPQSWDQKDVQKILSDSPWSKQLSLGMAADGSLSQTTPAVGTSGVSETSGSGGGGMRPGAGPGPRDNGPTGASGDFAPMAKFTVELALVTYNSRSSPSRKGTFRRAARPSTKRFGREIRCLSNFYYGSESSRVRERRRG